MLLDFLIVVTGYNGYEHIKGCYQSLLNQTYSNWKAIFIDDGSTDHSHRELYNLKNSDKRIKTFLCTENKGAAYRRWQVINELSEATPETVILLMGMDDELLPNCLERVKKEYDSEKWMTYGNWIDQHGKGLSESFEFEFMDIVHADRGYRKVVYRSTAPNTFKKFLFDKLTEEDFKHKGEWVKATTESNLMFSCLEMCGKDRIGVIKEPIYKYYRGRADNARKRLGDSYQDGIYKDVISRHKKDLL